MAVKWEISACREVTSIRDAVLQEVIEATDLSTGRDNSLA